MFALERLAHRVTLLENSQVAERSWVIIHSDHGPYVIGCWYRPPFSRRSRFHPQLQGRGTVACYERSGMCSVR